MRVWRVDRRRAASTFERVERGSGSALLRTNNRRSRSTPAPQRISPMRSSMENAYTLLGDAVRGPADGPGEERPAPAHLARGSRPPPGTSSDFRTSWPKPGEPRALLMRWRCGGIILSTGSSSAHEDDHLNEPSRSLCAAITQPGHDVNDSRRVADPLPPRRAPQFGAMGREALLQQGLGPALASSAQDGHGSSRSCLRCSVRRGYLESNVSPCGHPCDP